VDKYSEVRNMVFEHFSEEFFYNVFGEFKTILLLGAVTFDGPPGTLIVFDTDCLHRGGCLVEKQERKVIRGSSYRGFWPDV
jgi:hypothetical protein